MACADPLLVTHYAALLPVLAQYFCHLLWHCWQQMLFKSLQLRESHCCITNYSRRSGSLSLVFEFEFVLYSAK